MGADASIYGQSQPVQPTNQLAQLAQAMQVKGLQNQGDLAQYTLKKAQRDDEDNALLRSALSQPGADPYKTLLGMGKVKEAGDYQKNLVETDKSKAGAQKDRTEAVAKYVGMQGDIATRVMANPSPQYAALALDAMEGHAKSLGFDQMVPQIAAERQTIANMTPEQIKQWAAGHALKAEKLLPTLSNVNLGDREEFVARNPLTGEVTRNGSSVRGQTADNKATVGLGYAKLKEDNRHNGETEAQGAIEYKQDASGQWVALPKKLGSGPIQARPVAGPGGQPLPTKNEVSAKNALGIISEAEKLVDASTGSFGGAGVDLLARTYGGSTEGANAIAKLKALEGALMMAQPRMEGPQSDKDVALYRQMAAQLGDPTVPREQKKAALSVVKSLHQRYAPTAAASDPAAPSPAATFDADKERRYQDWKARQGK